MAIISAPATWTTEYDDYDGPLNPLDFSHNLKVLAGNEYEIEDLLHEVAHRGIHLVEGVP